MKVVKFLILILILTSCDVISDLGGMYNLSKCEFRVAGVDNIQLSGVNISNKSSYADLSMFDVAKLTSAFASGKMPLNLNLNLEVKNPNAKSAVMNQLEWILLIDNQEMTRGTSQQRFEVAGGNQSAVMPLTMQFDLMQVLSGKSLNAVSNFTMNLMGTSDKPSRIAMQLKPTVQVGGIPVQYPGYFTVQKEFTSGVK